MDNTTPTLSEIFEPIRDYLARVDTEFVRHVQSKVELIPRIGKYIQSSGGNTAGNYEQDTFSYYGKLNRIAFNVGYHNEHHDFPSVPWNNLPRVYAAAPELYGSLYSHQSWARLLVRFLTTKDLSALWNRVVRQNRGQVKLEDEVKPDQEA